MFSSMLEALGWTGNTFSSEIWSAQKQGDQKIGRNKTTFLPCVSPCVCNAVHTAAPQGAAPAPLSALCKGSPGRSPHLHLAALRHKSESNIFCFLCYLSLSLFFFFSTLFLVQLFCFVLFPFLSIGTTQIPLLVGASGLLLVTPYYIS